MVNYEETLVPGDILLEGGTFYQVMTIASDKKTMDLKCYNSPLIFRCVPISNLYEVEFKLFKEIPENITFLRQ